jgi:RecA-family ATPase
MASSPRRKAANGSATLPEHFASIASEQAVLGGLLLDSSAWREVADLLREEDFSRPDHSAIYETIDALANNGQACDPVTVSEQLERTAKLDAVGGLAYLSCLARETPTAANVVAYAKIVRDRASERRLLTKLGTGGDLADMLERELARLKAGAASPERANPLAIEPAAAWASRPEPPPRDWIIDGLIPAGHVTSMLGNGGLGKTLLAVQLGVHISMNRPIFGRVVSGGPVLGVFCEDEQEELERRGRAACAGEDIPLESLERLHMTSRDGLDNLLCTFDREQIVMTPFYRQLDATVGLLKPRLTIIDTAADVFGGDFMSTPQVRQFLKVALGGLCVRHGTAVLLLAHPSASGMQSGDGGGFSTAWNNSVRSRLFLRRPKSEDKEAAQDRRVLEVRKSNYAVDGTSIALMYQHGCFVPDPEPLEEGVKPVRPPRTDTRLAFAALEQIRRLAPAGGPVVRFGTILDALQAAGSLPRSATATEADKVRKTLQRALNQIADDGHIEKPNVPRGSYRLADPRAPEAS